MSVVDEPVKARTAGRATRPAPEDYLGRPWWHRAVLAVAAYAVCLLVFAAFAVAQGANASTLFSTMLNSSVLDWQTLQQTLIRSVPIVLAALACTVPARAGLVNVGGEGQIMIGSVAAIGVGLGLHGRGGLVGWTLIALAGALAGAVWCGICGWLRVRLGASESVTTLFFNFIAADVMLYAIYEVWRDGGAGSLPQTRPLAPEQMLPKIGSLDLTWAVPLTLLVVVVVWFLLTRTGWGFALRVAGGNVEAARRSGLPVRRLLLGSMAAGGLLAGLGGALNLMSVEGALRPGMTASFGYVAFLAAFVGGNKPFAVLGSAVLFSAIANSGNGLQLTEGLPGSTVNVLLGLIVLTTLFVAGRRKEEFA
ncbi:ABC transporter permease [Cellulomonas alba]|uniref:ABC transporter permease n=1 Tax=Cellulomonas alba TaxID=3053467 RepID=A0ABT7SEF1_9CELL|nr:ABC transporter permease [Cellulomonas alba]MDM7853919.1 ABC transporter permease [Cellulomonas alba]